MAELKVVGGTGATPLENQKPLTTIEATSGTLREFSSITSSGSEQFYTTNPGRPFPRGFLWISTKVRGFYMKFPVRLRLFFYIIRMFIRTSFDWLATESSSSEQHLPGDWSAMAIMEKFVCLIVRPLCKAIYPLSAEHHRLATGIHKR